MDLIGDATPKRKRGYLKYPRFGHNHAIKFDTRL